MSQYDFGDLESPVSGTELINTHLEPWRDALHSCHKGNSRPSYATAGMIWVDDTTNPWVVNMFDGSDDIAIGTVNASTNQFIPSNISKWGGTSGGTANVQTLTPSPALAAAAAGVAYEYIVGTPNTSAGPTLNISGTGAKTLKHYTSAGKVNVPIGAHHGVVRVVDDGTDYILLNARPYNQGTDIATASTVNLDNALGDYVHLTGTTTVTAITLAQGQERTCVADGAFILTNGASLILPGGANITTAAGDVFVVRGEASGVVRIVSYTKASGAAIVGGSSSLIHVQDQVASGTNGDNTTASWQTLRLNTVITNTVSGASLGSNQVTLPAGTYRLRGYVKMNFGSTATYSGQSRVQNITDGTTLILGNSGNQSHGTDGIMPVNGQFTLAGTKSIALQAIGAVGGAYGIAANKGTEMHKELFIEKVA